jgi:hypothetical protein
LSLGPFVAGVNASPVRLAQFRTCLGPRSLISDL